MKGRILLCLILYGLLFMGLLLRSRELLAFMMPFLVYVGVGLIYKPKHILLTATRTLDTDRALQGTPISVKLEITNEGSHLEEILLSDLLPGPLIPADGVATLLTSLESRETLHWNYTLSPRRGYYRFQGLKAIANDSFNLFPRQETLPVEDQLMILPNFIKLKQLTIRPRRTRGYSGFIPSRSGGHGIEFFGVREYQQGDSLRLINWKATARHSWAFFTNEFEQERITDVGLILDVRRVAYGQMKEDELLEHAISATAALAETFLSGGNRVGMFIYGRVLDWTFPGYGNLQKERILQALAKVKISEDSVFDNLVYLPTRLFPSHSQLIFISPLVRNDIQTLVQIRARGYQLLVVSPDPVSFEEETLKHQPDIKLSSRIASLERMLLLRELQQAGVRVFNWPVRVPLELITGHRFNRQIFQRR